MAKENKDLETEELEENEGIEDKTSDEGIGEDTGKDSDAGKAGDKGGKAAKTFTQEQVNKMMTREKNQGRAAVYKELGINPKDTKAVAMFKAFIESQKTDEQKTAEKNAEEQQKIEEANRRALTAEAKAEAMQLGCKAQFVDDIVTLALARISEDGDMKTIIGEFKTKYPVWFEKGDDDGKGKDAGKKTGQKGTGSSLKTQERGTKKGEEQSLGQRLAAQRKKSTGKASYWGNNKK